MSNFIYNENTKTMKILAVIVEIVIMAIFLPVVCGYAIEAINGIIKYLKKDE